MATIISERASVLHYTFITCLDKIATSSECITKKNCVVMKNELQAISKEAIVAQCMAHYKNCSVMTVESYWNLLGHLSSHCGYRIRVTNITATVSLLGLTVKIIATGTKCKSKRINKYKNKRPFAGSFHIFTTVWQRIPFYWGKTMCYMIIGSKYIQF